MARACSPALRLQLPPNPAITTPLLPSCRTHSARCRGFTAHAQRPAAGRPDEPAAEPPPKQPAIAQSLRRNRRRGPGSRQSLVSVGTSCGGGDQWSSDFDLTLRQLHLDDLIEDDQNDDADVLVHLLVQQHTQFGMSIKGRVVTSFSKICDSCSSPYCAKITPVTECVTNPFQCDLPIGGFRIDEQFNLTVLSSTRKEQSGMPDIGDSDPSRSLKRLLISESPDGGNQKKSYSQRWSKLLDLKKTLDKAAN
uniref:Large ribosomal RNA subunit accumulation protein YceD n=1 Tax=Oryza punctata TaxID=4537 RepID=A0A0E0KSZ8_ORYPU